MIQIDRRFSPTEDGKQLQLTLKFILSLHSNFDIHLTHLEAIQEIAARDQSKLNEMLLDGFGWDQVVKQKLDLDDGLVTITFTQPVPTATTPYSTLYSCGYIKC